VSTLLYSGQIAGGFVQSGGQSENLVAIVSVLSLLVKAATSILIAQRVAKDSFHWLRSKQSTRERWCAAAFENGDFEQRLLPESAVGVELPEGAEAATQGEQAART
jgi:hypothetical protein